MHVDGRYHLLLGYCTAAVSAIAGSGGSVNGLVSRPHMIGTATRKIGQTKGFQNGLAGEGFPWSQEMGLFSYQKISNVVTEKRNQCVWANHNYSESTGQDVPQFISHLQTALHRSEHRCNQQCQGPPARSNGRSFYLEYAKAEGAHLGCPVTVHSRLYKSTIHTTTTPSSKANTPLWPCWVCRPSHDGRLQM